MFADHNYEHNLCAHAHTSCICLYDHKKMVQEHTSQRGHNCVHNSKIFITVPKEWAHGNIFLAYKYDCTFLTFVHIRCSYTNEHKNMVVTIGTYFST